ncbi:hypothetical protein HQN84_18435 [Pedobacter steynii]|uniref:hypothetical protein n=1 Tax=Pedobacter steynii TaxID=430522 RepID=UPI00115FE47E|nr:hypothetical protein [Pedobacter steynii]NQX40833.1 hypothetical protein [Pedobacter steynii]
MNASAFQAGEALTRSELKKVLGGMGSTGSKDGCCAHNADWSNYQCGYPDAQQAENAASIAAQQDPNPDHHYYWCCQSCPR